MRWTKSARRITAVGIVLLGVSTTLTAQTASFQIVEDRTRQRIDISVEGQPFTSYLYPDSLMKPVLFPLMTATGDTITRGWPLAPMVHDHVDHPHHIGLWFNYESTNGLDFWNNSSYIPADRKQHYGSIRHVQVDKMETGPDSAVLAVTSVWLGPDEEKLLRQQTTYIFKQQGHLRSIVMQVKLTALARKVVFKDIKDGLIALRLRTELEQPSKDLQKYINSQGQIAADKKSNEAVATGHYTSSEGIEGDAVWSSRGKWVTLDGRLQGKDVSVTILDHPGNVGYPTYWHARGYGLFAANPLGGGVFSKDKKALNLTLQPSDTVSFQYKVLIGEKTHPTKREIQKAFEDFAASY